MMRKKVFLLASLLVISSAVYAAVSFNKAGNMVASEFPELGSPNSVHSYTIKVSNGSYFVYEFEEEGVWVAVDQEKGDMASGDVIKPVFSVYYSIKNIRAQKESEGYPGKSPGTILKMHGDVKSQVSYIKTWQQDLPEELSEETDSLLKAAEELDSAFSKLSNEKGDLEQSEEALLESSSSTQDVENWKRDFSDVLTAKANMIEKAYAYENESQEFIGSASDFKSKNDTELNQKKTVNSFLSGISISRIPGSLPGMESTLNKWKNWFQTTLSEEKTKEEAERRKSNYEEILSEKTVEDRKKEATNLIEQTSPKVEALKNKLEACSSELDIPTQKNFGEMKDKMEKAQNSYQEAKTLYQESEYDAAKEEYLNAFSYAEDAEEQAGKLEGTNCPEEEPEPQGIGEILANFVSSIWGLAFFVLVIALIVIWVISHRGGEEYEEDYDYYDY